MMDGTPTHRLNDYANHQIFTNALDFDDLIQRTAKLLDHPTMAQWVLFRLDGGIDHILVDEAQDTSPGQWAVIERLADEFAAGEGREPSRHRTVFVVGDRKQSIFSFQGADAEGFDRMQRHFGERLGRIGQALARRAKAFGLQIHYHNRRRVPERIEAELDATYWESLDQMLARMDIISVNAPHTPSTFHLLNARRLKLLKPTAVVVNTSRGEVIDENALTRMLRAGEIAGAGLDVFEHGHEINPRLRELPNVVLLPHMGSATVEGRAEMGEKVIINIKTFADGHRPPDLVVPSML